MKIKYFVVVCLLLIPVNSFSADYYVKTGGNDSANGLSDANAWETVAKVNATSFSPGDNIYFNKGDSWVEKLTIPSSGSIGNRITFSSYGTGARPNIQGVYASNKSFFDIKNLEFEATATIRAGHFESISYALFENNDFDGKSLGENYASATCLSIDGVVGGNSPSHTIVIRKNIIHDGGNSSVTTYGGGIKLNNHVYNVRVVGNVVYDNIETNIQSYCDNDPACGQLNYDIYIIGNEVYNTGANILASKYETGINIGWSTFNHYVERNYVHDIRIPIQTDSGTKENYVFNNIIVNASTSMLRVLSNGVGDNVNTFIYNNTFIQLDDSVTPFGIDLKNFSADSYGHVIKNNIGYAVNPPHNHIRSYNEDVTNPIQFTSDNNLFYTLGTDPQFILTVEGITYNTLAEWQAGQSQDANSLDTDPLLVDVNNGQYNITNSSPAKDSGETLAKVNGDYRNLIRPQGSGYDLGAYENGPGITFSGVIVQGIEVE